MALDPATSGFLLSCALAFGVTVVCVVVFSLVRNRFKNVYQFRRLIHQWKANDDFNCKRVGIPAIVPRPTPFAWISAALASDEDEVVREIGLDAAMYLRYLRSMFLSFAIISVIGVCVLMPVYGTGTRRHMTPSPSPSPSPGGSPGAEPAARSPITGLRIVSLANVNSDDPRMWATFVMELFSTLVFLYFMFHDYKRYAELRRKNLTAENPKNYAIAVYDVPKSELTPLSIKARFDLIVPNQIASVIIVKNNAKARKLHKKLDAAVANREVAEWVSAKKLDGDRPEHRVGCCGMCRCWQSKVDSIEHWESEQERLGGEIIQASSDADETPSAIIIFKNKRAASLLVQANMADDATQWNVEKMPEPKAINWGAFNVPGYQAEVRRVGVLFFVLVLTLFWTIPAFGLASLINLQALAENDGLKFLKPLLTASPALTGLLQGLLPVIVLAVIVALIPVVIRLVVRLERIHSEHIVDRKTRDYFYFFTIYGSFFCVVVGSSILEEIKTIAESPFKLFDLLGQTIPGNGIFFANYIVVQAGINVSLELLNPLRLILVSVFLKMAKTERQRRKAQFNGCEPNLFKRYGSAMLIAFMGIMYTPLAPIVPVTAFIFFGYSFLVTKYNFLYNMYAESDGGGESYPGAFWGTLVALLLRHGIVIVLVGFKSGKAIAPFCIIPLIITICFGIETGRRFRRVSMFGSLHDHFSESSELDKIPSSYLDEYAQPAIKPEVYQNLNGVAEVDDYHDGCRDIPDEAGKDIEDPEIAVPAKAVTEEDKEDTMKKTD